MKPLTANPNAKALWRQYRKSARKRGLAFELDLETFVMITQHNCYLCGVEPKQRYVHDKQKRAYTTQPFVYNGVDRVSNDMPYVVGSLMACCGTCNMAKKEMDVESFLVYVKRVYEYNFGGTQDGLEDQAGA